MPHTWTYKNYEIHEGVKPKSEMFRYFFRVLKDGQKKCTYCIWIVDDALDRFDPSRDVDAVIASGKASWHAWVKKKIDDGDFRNRALRVEKAGEQEINLSDMSAHVRPS